MRHQFVASSYRIGVLLRGIIIAAASERSEQARFLFAPPHHSWERGTNENTNGLIRQYLPKGQSMAHLSQRDCDRLALKLNRRPRKRLGYRTPEECYES